MWIYSWIIKKKTTKARLIWCWYANIVIIQTYMINSNDGSELSVDPTTTCPAWRTSQSYILNLVESDILLPFSPFLCSYTLTVLTNVSQRPILMQASAILILTYERKIKNKIKSTDSPRMLGEAVVCNSLPNRMSYLPAALPIQISSAQWKLHSTHTTVSWRGKLQTRPLISPYRERRITSYNQ